MLFNGGCRCGESSGAAHEEEFAKANILEVLEAFSPGMRRFSPPRLKRSGRKPTPLPLNVR